MCLLMYCRPKSCKQFALTAGKSSSSIWMWMEQEHSARLSLFEGLLNLCLLDMPIATVQTLKLLQVIRVHIANIGDRLQSKPSAAPTQTLTGGSPTS